MTRTPPRQPETATTGPRESLNAFVGKQVLRTLGEPTAFLTVQVRPLWENYYRVNVLVGADTASARIPNSYFVEADGQGNILASTPKLTRQYLPPA